MRLLRISNFRRVPMSQVFSKELETGIVREAVGVFDTVKGLEAAIDELESSGFERRQISVLGSEGAVKDTFGKANLTAKQLEDNPETPRSHEIRREELGVGQGVVVGGGAFAGILIAAAISGVSVISGGLVTTIALGAVGGTAVGALVAKFLGEKYVDFFEHQIQNGGLLLWVVTPDVASEKQAKQILLNHNAKDVHVHTIPVYVDDE